MLTERDGWAPALPSLGALSIVQRRTQKPDYDSPFFVHDLSIILYL
jgi:hypothetical protein